MAPIGETLSRPGEIVPRHRAGTADSGASRARIRLPLVRLLALLVVPPLLVPGEGPLAAQDPDSIDCGTVACGRTLDAARAWQIGPALAGYGRVESGGYREGVAVWITERSARALTELLRAEGRLSAEEARAMQQRLRSDASERHVVLWAPRRAGEANCAPGMYERIYERAVGGARLVAESPTGTVESPVEAGDPERVGLPDRGWTQGLRDAWILRFPRTDPSGRSLVTLGTERIELRLPWTTRTAKITFEVEGLPAEGLGEL